MAPPHTKKLKSSEGGGGGGGEARALRSIELALQSAIGSGLPIPQLLSIIAAYTQPFVSRVTSVCQLYTRATPNRLCDVSTASGDVGLILSADSSDRFILIPIDTPPRLLWSPLVS